MPFLSCFTLFYLGKSYLSVQAIFLYRRLIFGRFVDGPFA